MSGTIKMTREEKLNLLNHLPWTIIPAEGQEQGIVALRLEEIPDFVVAGDSREIDELFEDAKRAWFESFLDTGDDVPMPEGFPPFDALVEQAEAFRVKAYLSQLAMEIFSSTNKETRRSVVPATQLAEAVH